MPYFNYRKESVYYMRHDDGASKDRLPLVLIHGAAGASFLWPPDLRRMPGRIVYALDLPGHARSRGRSYDDIAEYVQVVRTLVDAEGLERFILVGHSMGGAIAQSLAIHDPQGLAALCLIGTTARFDVLPMLVERSPSDDYRDQVIRLLSRISYSKTAPAKFKEEAAKMLATVPAEVIHADFSACSKFDVSKELHRISVPALIVAGQDDRMTPVRFSQGLHAQIRNSHLEILEGIGHMIPIEYPGLAAMIAKWAADSYGYALARSAR